MELKSLSVKEFIDKVTGNDPVPGGGSVSALNGSLAASLAAMVANLTVGRKKYAEVNDEMEQISARMTEQSAKLLADVDRDAEAYDRVFAAFKLPQESDEENAVGKEAIQRETTYAAEVPMEVARTASALLPMIDAAARRGNSNAVTDATVAMMCARTAVIGALLNVRINLTSITDEAFVKTMTEEADRLEAVAVEAEHKLLEYVKAHAFN